MDCWAALVRPLPGSRSDSRGNWGYHQVMPAMVSVVKLNVDENPLTLQISNQHIPTMLIFKDGKLITMTGGRTTQGRNRKTLGWSLVNSKG